MPHRLKACATCRAWMRWRRKERSAGYPFSAIAAFGAKQKQEYQCVGDEQRRNDCRWKVERGSERPRVKLMDIALVHRVQQVARAPHIEYPHKRDGPGGALGERQGGCDREYAGDKVAVRRGDGEGCGQRGRDNAGDQEAESDGTKKHVGRDQGKKRVALVHGAKARPDEEVRGHARSYKAHQSAEPKQSANIHRNPPDDCASFVRCTGRRVVYEPPKHFLSG